MNAARTPEGANRTKSVEFSILHDRHCDTVAACCKRAQTDASSKEFFELGKSLVVALMLGQLVLPTCKFAG